MNTQPVYIHLPNLLLTFILLTLSACSSSPKSNFYQLEQAASSQLTGLERGTTIGIGPINLAPYLERPQIVTRSGPHKLELSEFNRWTEPLKVSISRVIAVNLSNKLNTNRVYVLPRRKKSIPLDYRVSIDIARFDGQLGGKTQMTARWSVFDKNDAPLVTKVSIINKTADGKDYEHLVATENQILQQLSKEIAQIIQSKLD